uniref:Uncharacterized protein n=1 Tax=Tanacetum cinerariifolium TaxID=118510 RepID=A0A6L2JHG8_TANCI|nr:hypothetical protein [Tanacetum cinerariifolium]
MALTYLSKVLGYEFCLACSRGGDSDGKKHSGINAAGLSLTNADSRLMLLSKADTATEETKGITLKGLYRGYDRFQTLLSQLEIHGAGVLHKDANKKFLRSLPSSWSQMGLIIRTKPGLDILSFDDLYNNLRVFEHDVKGTTASSSSNTQNVAFVSTNNTSSTTDVSTAYSVSSPSVSKSQKERSSSYTDEVIYSFFANQSSAPQLDYDDLEQIMMMIWKRWI